MFLPEDGKCNTEVHWNNKRCLPKTKQNIKKQTDFVRNKKKSSEL